MSAQTSKDGGQLMYSAILKRIFYPMGEKLVGTTMLKYLKEVEETQWWSPEQLRELQNEKLRALVKHAYENVPYYHHIFEERGLTDKDIQTAADLAKLPILTKDDIRRNFEDLMATHFKKWKPFVNATSGSTGEPLKYYFTMDAASINWASTFRGCAWAGYKLGDKQVLFGGSSVVPSNISPKFRLRYYAERKMPLSSLAMTEKTMKTYISKMKRFKPRYAYGYPSAISIFAKYISEQDMDSIRLQAVFTTAETLLPNQRLMIESVFGCKVFDQYGCYDGGPQALECPTHQGYHLSAEKAIMEFVDENGNLVPRGRRGEIISTDLHNYAMPFIRYATGDVGILAEGQCSCGRGLPLMKSIEGRAIDLLVLKDGSKVSGLPLTDVFEHIEEARGGTFKQYRIVQQTVGEIVVKIVKGPNWAEQDALLVINEFKKHLGEDTNIGIEFVDEIPASKGGKYRFVVSRVSR